jgi:hypothetical protein
MTTYKAMVKDKDTKKNLFVSFEQNTKKDFIFDIRANGYSVNTLHVKEEKIFDKIVDTTNCEEWDWLEITFDEYMDRKDNLIKKHMEKYNIK